MNVPKSPHPHQKEEFKIARKSLEGVVTLLERGYTRIALCHGNGPQVGQIFMQQEMTRREFPRQVTLDVCVADSQGRIGYILQNVLDNLCRERGVKRKAFAVITQVEVNHLFLHKLLQILAAHSLSELKMVHSVYLCHDRFSCLCVMPQYVRLHWYRWLLLRRL